MKFIDELRWRGMVHDVMPGLEELLDEEQVNFYHGIDPTADSIHVGHFVGVMAMRHFQMQGHRPYALIGGATGMIGDPSGKSEERNLLSEEVLRHNENCIKAQLERFLDFDGDSGARVVNNYDWFKDLGYLEFIRDIGKHITVSYMMAKDSVKSRLESGMSFTEFTYQLAQGYDFYHLYKEENCKLQIGGSDQWGNIVTGSELIRRKAGGSAFALTWPLVTKADGRKFGKTEQGNIWLDAKRTSAYKFYQFWLNSGDEEALNYLRLFTFMHPGEIEELETGHKADPSRRLAQTKLAEDLTERVHSKEDLEQAVKASSILFGKSTKESLLGLNDSLFQDIFEGVPQFAVSKDSISGGVNLIDLLSDNKVLASKGEVRRALKENSLSLNKEKGLSPETTVGSDDLLNGKYLLVQRGKKNYYLIVAS